MDLVDPLAAGIDWTFAHWFAIVIAAFLASLAVKAVRLIEAWRGLYR